MPFVQRYILRLLVTIPLEFTSFVRCACARTFHTTVHAHFIRLSLLFSLFDLRLLSICAGTFGLVWLLVKMMDEVTPTVVKSCVTYGHLFLSCAIFSYYVCRFYSCYFKVTFYKVSFVYFVSKIDLLFSVW